MKFLLDWIHKLNVKIEKLNGTTVCFDVRSKLSRSHIKETSVNLEDYANNLLSNLNESHQENLVELIGKVL